MIAGLSQYKEYRPTSSRWIGDVPSHWTVRSLRNLTRARNERNHADAALLSVVREKGVIVRDLENDNNHNVIPDDLSNYKFAYEGDLVINKMKAWQGSMGIAPCNGIVSPAYYVFEFAMAYRQFAHKLLRSKPYVDHFAQASDGVRIGQWDLSIPGMREIPVVIPPEDEQKLIVRFLDWANVRLEKAVRAKRRVIALLEEQKQAIIHSIVTRGLGKNVERSSAHAPWLDGLPVHWPVYRAKLLFHQVRPPLPENAEQVTCFRDGQVTLRTNRRTTGFTNATLELGYQGILPGQLVLHSMDAFAGAIGVSDSSGKCSPEYVICEPSMEGLRPEYYGLLLRNMAIRGFLVMLCPSVRQRAPRVRYNDFGSFVLPKPPEHEQLEILENVRSALVEIESTIAAGRRRVELLLEYRTRLISDVVTGKLDVRDVSRSLPSESELMEPIDRMTTPDADFEAQADDELETQLTEEAV